MSVAFPLKKTLTLSAGGLAIALVAGTAMTQTASAKVPSGISMQCSAEANAKGLHGNERQAFRRHCIHEAMHESAVKAEHRRHLANEHRQAKHEASAGQPHKKDIKSNGDKPKTDKTT